LTTGSKRIKKLGENGVWREEKEGRRAHMQHEEVAEQALKLGLEERAELAERLLLSLDEAPESDIERLWLEEAERRLMEFREGKAKGIRAEETFRRAIAEIS
jgi:putative addiction module component (TIGR02574 family)